MQKLWTPSHFAGVWTHFLYYDMAVNPCDLCYVFNKDKGPDVCLRLSFMLGNI